LVQLESFRKAMYFGFDRSTFSSSVRIPSIPTYGFLGVAYYSTEFSQTSYRLSSAGMNALSDYEPETYGYNEGVALELFIEAYELLISEGIITDGEKVSVEYTYSEIETSYDYALWIKESYETIFNSSTHGDVFEFVLRPLSYSAYENAKETNDFDIIYVAWQGINQDAAYMLGLVYNSNGEYMIESGFDTANALVSVELADSKIALSGWINDFETTYQDYLAEISTDVIPSDEALSLYESWVALYDLFDGNVLNTTYDELFNYAYEILDYTFDYNYDGKSEDFNKITAALEGVLLDQMIAIPLFSTLSKTIYSERVIIQQTSYNPFISWGNYKYIHLTDLDR